MVPGFFLLPFMIIVIMKWRQRPTYIKMLGIFGGVSVIAFVIQYAMILVLHIPRGNNFVYNCYILFEVIFLLLIFYVVVTSKQSRRRILISIFLYFIMWLADVVYHGFWNLNSYARSGGSILLIWISISFFYTLMRDLPAERIFKFPMFWLATAVLGYNAGIFIFFVLLEYLVVVLNNDLMYYWTFQTLLRTIFNLFLIVCVWQDLRNHRQS